MNKKTNTTLLFVLFVLFIFGIGTGWLLSTFSNNKDGKLKLISSKGNQASNFKTGQTFGEIKDNFDKAIGIVKKNEVSGEGTHRLLREGGESQTVYLTSSLLDLDMFIDKKVQIWGETQKAKVGWLIDVMALKVLE